MQHYWSLDDTNLDAGSRTANTWVTIGSFDGVHLGHQAILRQLIDGAHAINAPVVVVTFHPHPARVLRNQTGPFYLTSPEERAHLLGSMGVDGVITHPFDRHVAGLSAYDFMSRLHNRLGISHLCIGHDFALGRNREGDFSVLQQLGAEFGYTVGSLSPITLDGQIISSSMIRKTLADGDVARAWFMLGRAYQITGKVIHGDGRGHTIGIPTANLDVWHERLIPKPGVYACLAKTLGETFKAVTNIGYRPTFDRQETRIHIETHLLEFDQTLYGHDVRLSFLEHLRDEQRFTSVQELVGQIQLDIAKTQAII